MKSALICVYVGVPESIFKETAPAFQHGLSIRLLATSLRLAAEQPAGVTKHHWRGTIAAGVIGIEVENLHTGITALTSIIDELELSPHTEMAWWDDAELIWRVCSGDCRGPFLGRSNPGTSEILAQMTRAE